MSAGGGGSSPSGPESGGAGLGRVWDRLRGRRPVGPGSTGQADPATPCGTCRHVREAHDHYRAGTDCALCDCPEFA